MDTASLPPEPPASPHPTATLSFDRTIVRGRGGAAAPVPATPHPPPLALSPSEALCVFPTGPPSAEAPGDRRPHPLAGPPQMSLKDKHAGDEEEHARRPPAEVPLTAAEIVDGLAQWPALHSMARINVAMSPLVRVTGYRLLLQPLLSIAFIVGIWRFNDLAFEPPYFGRRQLVVGTVGLVLGYTLPVLGMSLLSIAFSNIAYSNAMLGSHSPLAPLVRWASLCKTDPKSKLIRHVEGDALCSCPRPECAGGLPGQAAFFRVLVPVITCLVDLFWNVMVAWTMAVTFASETWTNWWSALVTALFFVAIGLIYTVPTHIVFSFHRPSLALLGLVDRIRCRASDDLVNDMLDRHALAATDPSVVLPAPADEPYVALHLGLSVVWPKQAQAAASGREGVMMILIAALLAAIINSAGAGCIPLWAVAQALTVAVFTANDLVSIAAANDGVRRVARLHRVGRHRCLLLLGRVDVRENPMVRASLEVHEKVLGAFADADAAALAVFLGYEVTPGLVKTAIITASTVALAGWSLIRGVAVGFSLDTMCPS